MIPNPAVSSADKKHEFIDETDEEQNNVEDGLIHGFGSPLNVEPGRRSPSKMRKIKDEAKSKLMRCLRAYKRRRLYWIITLLIILLIFLFWPSPQTSAYTYIFNYMPRIKYNVPDMRLKEKPVTKKTFTNPTQFLKIDDLKIEPSDHIPILEISINVYDVDFLNIVIRDSKNVRYEVPFEYPYPHPSSERTVALEESLFDLKIDWDNFNIEVIRRDTKEVLFSFKDRFIYTDLYIEFSFDLPTREVYGIGERLTSLQLKPGYYTIFTINRSGFIDNGQQGLNQEGHHPMYLVKEVSGKYHINLIRNLSPQEAVLREDTRITWKLTGGVLDLNFFLGDTAEEATEKYHRYCGGWAKPALWHLGTHINKWFGYKTVDELEFVLAQHERLQIPLDVLWSDIDVYDGHWNMVPNTTLYPSDQMKDLYDKYQKKWIPVVDAFVNEIPLAFRRDLPAYGHPLLEQLFLRDQRGRVCSGWSFLNQIRLVDFMNPNASYYWSDALEGLYGFFPFAGVWLDDNEITIFKTGGEDINQYRVYEFYDLPFYPGGKNFYELPLPNENCLHYGGIYEHDVRSLASLFQSMYTFDHLKRRHKFPFVLSRGTMFGGAQFASHWIPDTFSEWSTLRATIGTILSFQIFGYSMIGADVCGFIGNNRTEPELCARWYQAAVFHPFHRNSHQPTNELNNWQEPYMYFGEYYKGITKSINMRYSLLRHFYTLFFEKKMGEHGQNGYGMVLKPMFIEFGKERDFPSYGDVKNEEQFMVGSSILTAPALYPNVTEVEVYLPPSTRWYDLRTFEEVSPDEESLFNVSAAVGDEPPYFLRGGYMIIKQDTQGVLSSADLGNKVALIAGADIWSSESKAEIKYNLMLLSDLSNETNVYNNCVLKDCMVTLELIISKSSETKREITLKTSSSSKASNSDEHVYIDAFYIMGLDLSSSTTSTTNSGQTTGSGTVTWKLSNENTHTIKISFDEPLTINRSSQFTWSI